MGGVRARARAARASRSSTRRIRARSRAAAASPAARSRSWPTRSTPARLARAPSSARAAVHADVRSRGDRRRSRSSDQRIGDRRLDAARSSSPAARRSTPRCSRAARARGRRRWTGRGSPTSRVDARRRDARDAPAAVAAPTFVIGADGANSLVRRRVARAVPARSALDRHRLLRARRHAATRSSIELTPIRPATSGRFRGPDHLAIGICAQADAGVTAGGAARADGATGSPRRGIARRRAARAVLVADSVAERARLRRARRWPGRAGRSSATPPASSIRSRAKASTSRSRPASGSPTRCCRRRRRVAPTRRACATRRYRELARAARLKAGFFRPAFTGLMMRALQQSARDPRGDGRSRRRPAELRGAEMAAAEDVRDRAGVARLTTHAVDRRLEVAVARPDAQVRAVHRRPRSRATTARRRARAPARSPAGTETAARARSCVIVADELARIAHEERAAAGRRRQLGEHRRPSRRRSPPDRSARRGAAPDRPGRPRSCRCSDRVPSDSSTSARRPCAG